MYLLRAHMSPIDAKAGANRRIWITHALPGVGIPDPSLPPPPPPPVPALEAGQSYAICWAEEYEGGDLTLLKQGVALPLIDWKVSACPSSPSNVIMLANPTILLTEPDRTITQQLDGAHMEPITGAV